MRKLDNMHYLFNKLHSSNLFVMTSSEKFQTLKIYKIYISSSDFTLYFTTISAKNSITAGWLRIAPIKFVNSNSANSRL